jgi:hypothetical protein
MDAATETKSLPEQVRTLTEGDIIEVKYGRRWDVNQPEVRTVSVTELMETDSCFYVFTTSGRTNGVKGGCLALRKDDNSVTFQATMRQQAGPVVSLSVAQTV